jgi:HK97 family phage prohead protease
MKTVIGIVADRSSFAQRTEIVQGPTRPELRSSFWSTPSSEVRRVQAPRIPIENGHGGEVLGQVIHLERDDHGRLWAVAHVSDDVAQAVNVRVGDATVAVATELFWSAERVSDLSDRNIEIRSVALTPTTARISAQPVRFLDGALDHRDAAWRHRHELPHVRELLERAAHAHADRAPGSPIVVAGIEPQAPDRPAGRLQIRSATQLGVSDREIDLVIAPAEEPALVEHHGRMVTETIARNAFAGSEERAHRVRVLRDHDNQRVVGRAVELDPYSEHGLLGRLRIARTPLGEETLQLAREELLDASAAFLPTAGGEEWQGRSARRITRAFLGHVGLTPDPAFEGARVLSVGGAALSD